MEGTIGEIRLFAGNFPPKNWAFCQGQILSIAQNTALFSILGTTYGGNGQTTFGLPDLRGRVPLGAGQGPGLTPRALGEQSGEENHTLIITEMPAHNHTIQGTLNAVSGAGNTSGPSNALPAASTTRDNQYSTAASNTTMAAGSLSATAGIAGGNQPHNNMQPYLGLNYIICMFGIFPSRN